MENVTFDDRILKAAKGKLQVIQPKTDFQDPFEDETKIGPARAFLIERKIYEPKSVYR